MSKEVIRKIINYNIRKLILKLVVKLLVLVLLLLLFTVISTILIINNISIINIMYVLTQDYIFIIWIVVFRYTSYFIYYEIIF